MGIGVSGLDRLVTLGYRLLGLISFLTAGPKEVRAWTIENARARRRPPARSHSDFERGFIRAEIVAYDDLVREGSMNACKEKGLVRSEGKDYVMKDGRRDAVPLQCLKGIYGKDERNWIVRR